MLHVLSLKRKWGMLKSKRRYWQWSLPVRSFMITSMETGLGGNRPSTPCHNSEQTSTHCSSMTSANDTEAAKVQSDSYLQKRKAALSGRHTITCSQESNNNGSQRWGGIRGDGCPDDLSQPAARAQRPHWKRQLSAKPVQHHQAQLAKENSECASSLKGKTFISFQEWAHYWRRNHHEGIKSCNSSHPTEWISTDLTQRPCRSRSDQAQNTRCRFLVDNDKGHWQLCAVLQYMQCFETPSTKRATAHARDLRTALVCCCRWHIWPEQPTVPCAGRFILWVVWNEFT